MCCPKKTVVYGLFKPGTTYPVENGAVDRLEPGDPGYESQFVESWVQGDVCLGHGPEGWECGSFGPNANRVHTTYAMGSLASAQMAFYEKTGVWVDPDQCHCPKPQTEQTPVSQPQMKPIQVAVEQSNPQPQTKTASVSMPVTVSQQADTATIRVQEQSTMQTDYTIACVIGKVILSLFGLVVLAAVGVVVLTWQVSLWLLDGIIALVWWPVDNLNKPKSVVQPVPVVSRVTKPKSVESGILVVDWPVPTKVKNHIEK